MNKQIIQRSAKITVVGLGKMGLPLTVVFTHAGFQVKGLDISKDLIGQINQGITTIAEPFVAERLREAIQKNLFHATIDTEEAVRNADFIVFIIPVLTTEDGHADISILKSSYTEISKFAKKGAIYIQESTLPPGTSSGPLKLILENNGKKSGVDFGLVFAPERTFSGRAIYDIEENYPKIIGGDTENAMKAAQILYESFCDKGVITMSSATAAEAVKTFKGAYRDANIAIANEFAKLADHFGVDVLEIIEAANSEPFSHIHRPGIGVGGHCIPVYPQFLIAQGRDMNFDSVILQNSRSMNDSMVEYAIELVEKEIELSEKKVLVLGLAYRGGVKEYRMSPTLRLVPALRGKNADVKVSDPMFSVAEINNLFGSDTGIEWSEEIVGKSDIIFIATDHQEFKDLNKALENKPPKIIYDGRYVIDKKFNHLVIQPGRIVNK